LVGRIVWARQSVAWCKSQLLFLMSGGRGISIINGVELYTLEVKKTIFENLYDCMSAYSGVHDFYYFFPLEF
jgi:hypothetical protein